MDRKRKEAENRLGTLAKSVRSGLSTLGKVGRTEEIIDELEKEVESDVINSEYLWPVPAGISHVQPHTRACR